jgi:hypothetical protein
MVNFTVTVPEDLKTEMDRFEEVNWSLVFRNSVLNYIQARQNPQPKLDYELKAVGVVPNWASWRPDVFFEVNVKNLMDASILVDRMVLFARFYGSAEGNDCLGGFECYHLEPRSIPANSSSVIQVQAYPDEDFMRRFSTFISRSFVVEVDIRTYVQGFPNESTKVNIRVKVPFDEWKEQSKRALNLIDEKRRKMSSKMGGGKG